MGIEEALEVVSHRPIDTFQKRAGVLLLLGITSYDWLFFNLPFLGKQNQQLCKFGDLDETWTRTNCTIEIICAN